tara:strand:+ start:26228 stop:26632 length:405 start_codon:yes stop_codon:yes gene_type:complete
MNLKRSVWISVTLYLASMVFGIILALVLGLDEQSAVNPPLSLWIWGMILTVALTFLFTLWYFRGKSGSWKEGLQLGGVMILIGLLLDLLLVGFAGELDSLLQYYKNPLFFLTLGLLLATSSLVGQYKQKIPFLK